MLAGGRFSLTQLATTSDFSLADPQASNLSYRSLHWRGVPPIGTRMRPISNVDDTRGGERADEVHSCPFSSVPLRQTELDSCLTADCSRRSYDEHVHAFEPLTATSISTTVGATISIPSARAGDKAFGEAGWLI